MEIETQMAADKKRHEDQLAAEGELKLVKKAAPSKAKKTVTSGTVVKPVRKRAGRGF
jgi:pre-mRNA-splicing factor ATP-dependent RNA helicase DHX38/PRP16